MITKAFETENADEGLSKFSKVLHTCCTQFPRNGTIAQAHFYRNRRYTCAFFRCLCVATLLFHYDVYLLAQVLVVIPNYHYI